MESREQGAVTHPPLMLARSPWRDTEAGTAGSARAHWAPSPSSDANLHPRSSHSDSPSPVGSMRAVTVVHRHGGEPNTRLIFHRQLASWLFLLTFTLLSGVRTTPIKIQDLCKADRIVFTRMFVCFHPGFLLNIPV